MILLHNPLPFPPNEAQGSNIPKGARANTKTKTNTGLHPRSFRSKSYSMYTYITYGRYCMRPRGSTTTLFGTARHKELGGGAWRCWLVWGEG